MYLGEFERRQAAGPNALGLAQIRQAAVASQFESRRALYQWLTAAVGDNLGLLDRALLHAHRAVRLCPLQGEGYLLLGELSFLHLADDQVYDALLQQGARVRPYDGGVLFALGSQAALAGEIDQAIEHWREAFHHDPRIRSKIIETLTVRLPAADFIDRLEPDEYATAQILQRYRELNLHDEARVAAAHYLKTAVPRAATLAGAAAEQQWLSIARAYYCLDDVNQQIDALELAVGCRPENISVRRMLAQRLLAAGRREEAAVHLEWCLHRRPSDGELKQQLLSARRPPERVSASTAGAGSEEPPAPR